VRISGRDIAGLMLCGEMYGAPYDLLAAYLNVRGDRSRPTGAPLAMRRLGGLAQGRRGAG
jgi:hypothetical protein